MNTVTKLPKYPDIEVQLSGQDGNAFSIIANVTKALRRENVTKEEIDDFCKQAMSGRYNELLQTCFKWVTVL